MERPANLDSSFDSIIEDADTRALTADQQNEYMNELKLSERERLVVYEGGIEIGRLEGMKEGMEKGMEKERKKNAKSFLSLGVPVETIAKATGLSEEQILALKE